MTKTEHPSSVPASARPFQGRRAGIVSRGIACVADAIVVAGILAVIYGVIAALAFLLNPSDFHWPENLGWSLPVIGFVIVVPYLSLTWCTTGRSYGDALLGLRVVDARGGRIRVPRAIVRALLCVIFPIGILWVIVSPSNRSVQDLVTRTSTIYDWVPRPTAE